MTHKIESKAVKSRKSGESGNVLFLILIAVVLFAALSYAVTQSTRSGGGDVNNEQNLVKSAQITQYPASIRTALIRMIVTDGTSLNSLEFNLPSAFGSCTTPSGGVAGDNCVFHSSGGGAYYAQGPAEVLVGSTPTDWVFNGENQVYNIGVTTADLAVPTSASVEIIAFLSGVSDSICQRINSELGLNSGAIPAETSIDVTTNMDNGVGLASTDGDTIGAASGGPASLNGHAFGCFSQGGSNHYYHVLIEQ